MRYRHTLFWTMLVLVWPSVVNAQSMCATNAGTCVIPGVAPPGNPCYCASAMGPIPGMVAAAGAYAPANALPHFCCTPAGRLGPFQNTTIPAGGQCSAVLPNGVPMLGQACY